MITNTVYTQPDCNFSRAVLHMLNLKEWQCQSVDMSKDDQLRAEVARHLAQGSIPQIFVGERAIGGYSDFEELELSGEFARLLDAE